MTCDELPEPYYHDERAGIALYCGDCLELLPEFQAGSVDAVVTDPPYGNNYSTGWRAAVHRPATRLALDREALTKPLLNDTAELTKPLLNDTAELTKPLLNDTAAIYWHAAPDRLDMVLPVVRTLGDVVNVLCWDKGNCTAGDLDAAYGKQWEAIVFARVSRSPLIGGRDRDVLRIPRLNGNAYVHPTQKPVALMEYLIGRHDTGTVLDPFAGSGTTLVAAKRLGRKAVGIELSERYCEIAANRLRNEPMPLFVDNTPTERQPGLFTEADA